MSRREYRVTLADGRTFGPYEGSRATARRATLVALGRKKLPRGTVIERMSGGRPRKVTYRPPFGVVTLQHLHTNETAIQLSIDGDSEGARAACEVTYTYQVLDADGRCIASVHDQERAAALVEKYNVQYAEEV